MRELRTCSVTGVTVLLNDAWLDHRPPEHLDHDTLQSGSSAECPWCASSGVTITSQANAAGSTVRAIPHPTPALGVEGDARIRQADDRVWREAVGAHELLVGPHEGADGLTLRLAHTRIVDLRRDGRLRGFRVHRRDRPAGHAFWQLVALPFDVAPQAPARWRDAELTAGVRVVERTPEAVAIFAWAPRVPFEIWVLPSTGRGAFSAPHRAIDPAAVEAVAGLALRAREHIRDALGAVEIDVTLVDGEPWRLELLPRHAAPTPVESATGLPLHGVFPEHAARWIHRDRG